MNARSTGRLLAPALAAALLMGGCGPDRRGPAAVKVRAAVAAVSPGDVARVTLTVDGPAEGTSLTEAFSLSREGGAVWSVVVQGLPAGSYLFTLDAYDAADRKLYSGSLSAVIAPGVTSHLTILTEQLPTDPGGSTPRVDGISLSQDPVGPGAKTTISVLAASLDGLPLSFLWQDACGGSFSQPTAATTEWAAPVVAPAEPCQLSIQVAGSGASVTTYLAVHVQ